MGNLIVVQAPFISHLTNSYYGGSKIHHFLLLRGIYGHRAAYHRNHYEGMNVSLESAWKDLIKTRFEVQTRKKIFS